MEKHKNNKYIKTSILEFLKENVQYHDLFEYYDEQPTELREITTKYLAELEEGETDKYQILKRFMDEVYKIGYVFDYGLDAQPYGLRPIGVKLNQLVGWEEMGEGEH